ncbi:MAG: DNA-binding domain-containing protein [Burkholderiales bacterium]
MLSLREWQEDFVHDVLYASNRGAPFIRAAGLSAEKRLQIYRHNVFGNFTGTLSAVYPVVEKLVGENFFRHAARQYARGYPSCSGDIHEFGRHFPEFLAELPEAAELLYLPDVARLECLMHEAFHAEDCGFLSLERLAKVPPECYSRLKFELHPAVRLLASNYPVFRIWQTNQPHYAGDGRVDLGEGEVKLLLQRPEYVVELVSLSAGGYALLHAVAAGQDFSAAVTDALAAEPEFDPNSFLPEQVGHKVIVDFMLRSS